MPSAVIVDAVRSPMGRGKPGGALSGLHPVDLLAQVLTALVERTGIDPGTVDDVLVGCVGQAGEQSATPGRQAWLAAGFPVARAVGDDRAQVRLRPAGRRVRRPGHRRRRLRHRHRGRRRVDEPGPDGLRADGRRPVRRRRSRRRFPGLVPQGVSAELVADKWGLSPRPARRVRRALARAGRGRRAGSGGFDDEIVAGDRGRRDRGRRADETIRPGTTVERLAELKAVVRHRRRWRSGSPRSTGRSRPATPRRSPTARARCC